MKHTASRPRAARFVSPVLVTLAPLAALAAFASVLAEATPAFAQATDAPKKPKKKKPKPAAETPEETPAPAPAPAATTPAPEPTPAPDATPAPAAAAPPGDSTPPADNLEPITNVYEKPAKTYYFIGLRYRATIIPKFMMNLFVDEGTTVVSHSFGLELDVRRDDFSIIPSITYTSLGFGDTLFRQKGQPDIPQNYSDVNSGLNAIFVSADILWSKPISPNVSFEYGAGFGIGAIFGTLTNDWVYQTNGGPLTGSNGNSYAPCTSASPDPTSSCNAATHQAAQVNKVGGYHEPNWFSGGSIPVVFPQISIPELGIRYKPIKEVEGRLMIGFSLTGPFAQLSIDYGLESREREPIKPEDKPPSAR